MNTVYLLEESYIKVSLQCLSPPLAAERAPFKGAEPVYFSVTQAIEFLP